MDPISLIIGGASKRLGSLFSEYLFGRFRREPESGTEEEIDTGGLEMQGSELIQQIGKEASSPEEIPAALDGFHILSESQDGTVQKFFSKDQEL